MKRFQFRLERVLQLRLAAERERARALGEAQMREGEARALMETCDGALRLAVAQLAGEPAGFDTAGARACLRLAVEAARQRAEEAARAHRDTVARLEQELAQYEAARQARRALEKLREKRHDQWEEELLRHEQETLDEVALRMRGAGGRTA